MTASRAGGELAELTGAERDRAGRVTVEPDLTLPGHPEVFALGDMVASVRRRLGRRFPASRRSRCSRAATRPASCATGCAAARRRRSTTATRATSRRSAAAAAVADIKGLQLSGFLAWVTWLVVHLWYLVGFQNRLLVFIRWTFSFLTHGRGARLITRQVQPEA